VEEPNFGAWLEPLVEEWDNPLAPEIVLVSELRPFESLPHEPEPLAVQSFADPVHPDLAFGGVAAEAFVRGIEADCWEELDLP